VDRVDYSKGLLQKFDALESYWAACGETPERFTYLQVAIPSREAIRAYDELLEAVRRRAQEINTRFGRRDWSPLRLVTEPLSQDQLAGLYRSADVCLITSLQDGMNLVAKEYVASHVENQGVLILSRFAGAAEELRDAIQINPYDVGDIADALRRGLLMEGAERVERMRAMREELRSVFGWIEAVVEGWGSALGKKDRAHPF
jgi:trehalose-6-phosphate synthase